jgi:Cu(I)/Ag(I) efflux system membrane fusion protein
VGGFILGGLVWGGNRQDQTAPPRPAAESSTIAGAAPQLYTCSMHPQVRTPNPSDKCPICAMALIPVPGDDQAADDGDRPRLQVSPRAAALMQIQVHPVERRALPVTVRVYGQLGYDETRLRTIAAWAPGRLERLHVDFAGVAVKSGQPMVRLYSPQLIAAQEEYLQALRAEREIAMAGNAVARDAAQKTLAASHDRLRLLGLAADQIALLEQDGTVQDVVTIQAPAGGVVIDRLAAAGDYVETGQPIYRVADLSHLWAQLEVYETDLQWIAVGQDVEFTTQGYPDVPFAGKVAFIDPTVSERNRTVRIRVDVPNGDVRLKPGMFVRGVIQAGTDQAPALVIPATAPLITGERAVVYVQVPAEDRPTFEPRDVLLGARAGAWTIIRSGLQEGDLVVTNGGFKIDSELQIRGRPSMMQPAAAAPERLREPVPVPTEFRVQLGRLVEAGIAVAQALAADDPQAVGRDAAQATQALQQVEPAHLAEAGVRQQWVQMAAALRAALAALREAQDLTAQRRHFEPFSDVLTEAVQIFGVELAGAVYRAMCPMVQGRRGYWLQAERTIANPYFGAAMLRCGEIVDVLVAPAAAGSRQP